MAERPAFQRLQYAFAAHIREPRRHPRPVDVDERRMAVYRELFYNNVAGFISSTFPVLRSLYTETAWDRLVRDFFARHHSRTPLFLEISQEFLHYLAEEHAPTDADPPFLQELAHYEWAELAVSLEEAEVDLEAVDREADLLAGIPVLAPIVWLLAYTYPVHRIGPEFRPTTASETPHFLLVYRDATDTVGFMEVNAVTARLIELMQESGDRSGRDLLAHLAGELPQMSPAAVLEGGKQALSELRAAGVVLGCAREGEAPLG